MENILIDGRQRSRDQGREKPPRCERMVYTANGRWAVLWVITSGAAAFQIVKAERVRDGSDNAS